MKKKKLAKITVFFFAQKFAEIKKSIKIIVPVNTLSFSFPFIKSFLKLRHQKKNNNKKIIEINPSVDSKRQQHFTFTHFIKKKHKKLIQLFFLLQFTCALFAAIALGHATFGKEQ